MAKKITVDILKVLIDEATREVLEEATMRDRLRGLAAAGALAGGVAGASMTGGDSSLRKVTAIEEPASQESGDRDTDGEESPELPGGEELDAAEFPSSVQDTRRVNLEGGYDALNRAAKLLQQNAPVLFNGETPLGRATLGLAALLGGLESLGRGQGAANPFDLLGGLNRDGVRDRMVGFAQFDADAHADKIGVRFGAPDPVTKLRKIEGVDPMKYSAYLGRILQGRERQPNGAGARNWAAEFLDGVKSGKIKDVATLRSWMATSKLGGSNWDAVDGKQNGWARIPDLSEQIIRYVRGEVDSNPPAQPSGNIPPA